MPAVGRRHTGNARQTPLSQKKSNAIGYAKRQSRKSKTGPNLKNIDDVYEYQPGKNRRSNVRLDLDRDEAKESGFSGDFGVGSDGEIGDQVDRDALRARLIGENEEGEIVPSDDDEEIDSDGALEESDEEQFAGFFSGKDRNKSRKAKGKPKEQKRAVRFADVDLDEDDDQVERDRDADEDEIEDEDEDMEGDDDEFITLLDVLDGKGEIDMGDDDDAESSKPFIPKSSTTTNEESPTHQPLAEVSGESEDEQLEGEDDEEQEDPDLALSDDNEDEAAPEALADLESFITSLPTSQTSDRKRKADSSSGALRDGGPKHKKRLIIKERTETGAENEFRAVASGSKLQLEDLLAPLTSRSSSLQSLKKTAKALTSTSKKSGKALSAPLPQRTQDRLDREAAYQQTKEEVDKWKETMKRIREAEHLSFPLQDQNNMIQPSASGLNAKFKPSNDFESSIDALLKAAGMADESSLVQAEEQMLKANNLTLEEVAQRRGELRRMRELMFRAELKARRVNKIKSKTYRRLKRKEKERLGAGEGEDESEEGRMQRERERAMERATLKHKHTGKWAKQMKARGGALDEDQRRDMEEMLDRGEKLRRRIQGVGSDESEGDDESDEDEHEGEGEDNSIRIKQSAFDELQRINQQDKELEESLNNEDNGKRSVFNMKFMKEAMAREKARADKEADDFIKELGAADLQEDEEDKREGTQADPASGVVSQRVGGRLIFRPGAQTGASTRPLGSLASDTSSLTLRSADQPTSPAATFAASPAPLSPPIPSSSKLKWSTANHDTSNPWLTRSDAVEAASTSKASRKNEVVVSKDSKAPEKSKNKLRKLAKRQAEEKEKRKDDATLEIGVGEAGAMTLSASATTASKAQDVTSASAPRSPSIENGNNRKKGNNKGKGRDNNATARSAQDENQDGIVADSDADSEIEVQEQALETRTKGVKAFQQRDLVALAFAGDNVVQQFEETKRREIAADAPKQVDTTIPGWGSWGGSGTRKVPPKPSRIKTTLGIDPSTRADYNKKHIIISEKRDKKAAKYLVKDLPFPYTSKAQFERSMERPLGTEWNTRVGFQRATLPRVVMKPGVVITPLKKFS